MEANHTVAQKQVQQGARWVVVHTWDAYYPGERDARNIFYGFADEREARHFAEVNRDGNPWTITLRLDGQYLSHIVTAFAGVAVQS